MAQRRALTCQCEDLTSSSYNLHEKPHVVVDACNLSTVCVWQRVEVLDKRIYGDNWLPAELQVQKINVFQGSIVDSNRVLTSVYTRFAPYISNTHTHKTSHQFELTITFVSLCGIRETHYYYLSSFLHTSVFTQIRYTKYHTFLSNINLISHNDYCFLMNILWLINSYCICGGNNTEFLESRLI